MAMIKVAYNGYLNDKGTEEVKEAPVQAPVVVPVPAPVQTVVPVQTVPQVDPAIAARREMMLKFKAIIDADKVRMQSMDEDQKPLSRAYLSVSSFTKGKTLSKEEEKITKADGYHADKNKKLSTMQCESEVRNIIRKNLITGGGFPQAKVEETLAKVPSIPKELVQAYLDLQKSAIKYRLSEDEDYQNAIESD
jgi:hypothetical protein